MRRTSRPTCPRRLRGLCAALLLAAAPALPAAAAELVEGVSFPELHETRWGELRLTGTGLLRWYFLDAYVAALYLEPGQPAMEVLSDVPKRLVIEYFHGIDAEDFARATIDRVLANVGEAEFERLRPGIEELNALYRDVRPGDRYALTYVPGVGTELSLNGQALGTVSGSALARAVFAIWLGEVPLDRELKAELLGSG